MAASSHLSPHSDQVLIAAGDSITLDHLRMLLPRMGYTVLTVTDGLKALEVLTSPNPPPLAVLDWEMPGMNGVQICRRLQPSKSRRSTHIILLTRLREGNDRIQALAAGADDCLFKPLEPRELQSRLQSGAQSILERALHESNERFRGAFEYAGMAMAVVGVEGEFLQVNRALCDFLGYSADELLGLTLQQVSHPDDLPSCASLLEQFRAGGRSSAELERRFFTRGEGLVLWASLTLSTVVDADGRPSCFVVQLLDINQRKQAEAELRRSQDFLRGITDNVNDLIFVVSDENRYLYASPSHYDSLGYLPSELEGTDALRLVHPEDREMVERASFDVIQTGEAKIIELRVRHQNGSWRHLEAHGGTLRNSAGDVEGILIVGRLIDERLLAEQKLQAAYAETEMFLQSIPSILIGLDGQGRVTRWNLTAAKALGVSSEEVLGKEIWRCGIHWRHEDMQSEAARWLRTETTCSCENLAHERGGKTRFLGLNIRRLPAISGEGAGFIVTGADVTERKRLEEQLRQAQKLEGIGQLAAGIAHEINTPTQYVGDNIRFLKDSWGQIASLFRLSEEFRHAGANETNPSETLASYDRLKSEADFEYLLKEIPHAIDQSLDGLQRVSKIVRAIKEFSHPGSEEKRGVDLNRAIESTITIAKNEWKYIAEVETQFDETLPLVPCLAGEFNQVILNLIVNAAHAIGDKVGEGNGHKGKITVSTKRLKEWAEITL
ncbi:MAG TPA: PAS domain S-box protein, partial [Terriglobales bacterium]